MDEGIQNSIPILIPAPGPRSDGWDGLFDNF